MNVLYLFHQFFLICNVPIIAGTCLPEAEYLSGSGTHRQSFQPDLVMVLEEVLFLSRDGLLDRFEDQGLIVILEQRLNNKVNMFWHDDVGGHKKFVFVLALV